MSHRWLRYLKLSNTQIAPLDTPRSNEGTGHSYGDTLLQRVLWRMVLPPLVFTLIVYLSTLPSHINMDRMAIIWPANGFGIVVLGRTRNYKTGFIELILMLAGAMAVTLSPPISRPLGLSFGVLIAHFADISLATFGLRSHANTIFTSGKQLSVKELRAISAHTLMASMCSAVLAVLSFTLLDPYPHSLKQDFVDGGLWLLRHAAANAVFVWSLTLLWSRVPVMWMRVSAPDKWTTYFPRPIRAFKFLFGIAGIVATTFFASWSEMDTLYLILVVLCSWIAFVFKQPLNAAVQIFTYVFITWSKCSIFYKATDRYNAELNIVLYVVGLMSSYVSAAQYDAESSVHHIRSLLLEMKMRYTELQQSKDDLELVSKQSLLFAFMSHEFKTPLSIIIGFCHEICHTSLEQLALDSLNHILQMAEDLLQLTNEMLDIGRLKNGKVSLNIGPMDLHDTFNSCAIKLAAYGRLNKVNVEYSIAEGVPRIVFADKMRLNEILHNLGGNAIKFSSSAKLDAMANKAQGGGDAHVEIEEIDMENPEHLPKCMLQLQCMDKSMWHDFSIDGTMVVEPSFTHAPSTTQVIVRVTDQGRGIPPLLHKSVFNVYERIGTNVEQASTPGTGLGLAIVKELIVKMRGGIHVRSESGKGSTFSIILEAQTSSNDDGSTCSDVTPQKPRVESATSNSSLPVAADVSLHVLVVEDTPLNQKLIASILTRQGHSYELACNGQIALDLILSNDHLHRRRFDVGIIDLFMPIMGGEEFLRESRKRLPPHLTDMPVVVVSADISPDVRHRLLRTKNVASILEKPYRPAAIHAVLLEAMEKRHKQSRHI